MDVNGVNSIGPKEPNKNGEFKKTEEEMPNSILDYGPDTENEITPEAKAEYEKKMEEYYQKCLEDARAAEKYFKESEQTPKKKGATVKLLNNMKASMDKFSEIAKDDNAGLFTKFGAEADWLLTTSLSMAALPAAVTADAINTLRSPEEFDTVMSKDDHQKLAENQYKNITDRYKPKK